MSKPFNPYFLLSIFGTVNQGKRCLYKLMITCFYAFGILSFFKDTELTSTGQRTVDYLSVWLKI